MSCQHGKPAVIVSFLMEIIFIILSEKSKLVLSEKSTCSNSIVLLIANNTTRGFYEQGLFSSENKPYLLNQSAEVNEKVSGRGVEGEWCVEGNEKVEEHW